MQITKKIIQVDVSIIIVNYKTFHLTKDCIDSVLRFTNGIQYEIILVENGSGDFNETHLKLWNANNIKIIVSPENLGFAKGNNLGIESAAGKYILLLNSDTYLTNNAIKTTFDFAESKSNFGVLSARLIFPDGRHQSVAQRFPCAKYLLIELFRLQKLMTKKAAGKCLLGAFFDHRENTTADWVWGAYFLFPKEVLTRLPLGKLDDTYFMYFEDMQWCMDIKKLGLDIHFCAEAEVVHIMGGSSASKTKLMEQYEPVFLNRNYSKWHVALIYKLRKMLAS